MVSSCLHTLDARRHRGGTSSQEGPEDRTCEGDSSTSRYLKSGGNIRYPVAIEPGTETEAFGVVVPDLPGCFSAGDTMEEAMAKTEEAIAAWIETALDSGQDIPQPSSVEALRKKHREWKTWVWAVVKVDPAVLDDTLERVNMSLPRRVLHRLDALARATGETRSMDSTPLPPRGSQTEGGAILKSTSLLTISDNFITC